VSEKYPAMNDLTDVELIVLHHKCLPFPEDAEFCREIQLEIGRRYKFRAREEDAKRKDQEEV